MLDVSDWKDVENPDNKRMSDSIQFSIVLFQKESISSAEPMECVWYYECIKHSP